MKREENCSHCCTEEEKTSDLHLEISHVNDAGKTVRTVMSVLHVWTTSTLGPTKVKYNRLCECGRTIRGMFDRVVRWSIR